MAASEEAADVDAEAGVDVVAEDADAGVADSPRKPCFFVLDREM